MAALLWNRFSAPASNTVDPNHEVRGKTVIVTGATTGLGLEAARKYVELEAARVIITGRTVEKGEKAKAYIESTTKRTGVVEAWSLDYNSYDSIKKFAARVNTDIPKLDIVLLNAGVTKSKFELSPEGWEESIQVNVLSSTLLIVLLLPKLQTSWTPDWTPRLSVVGSTTHRRVAKFPGLDDPNVLHALNQPENFGGLNVQYGRSKLMLAYTVNELAEQLKAKGPDGNPRVLINHSCPGLCNSELGRDFQSSLPLRLLTWVVFSTIGKSPEEGSRTLVKASLVQPKEDEMFFKNDAFSEQGQFVLGDQGSALRKKVWGNLVEELSRVDDEVKHAMQEWSGK